MRLKSKTPTKKSSTQCMCMCCQTFPLLRCSLQFGQIHMPRHPKPLAPSCPCGQSLAQPAHSSVQTITQRAKSLVQTPKLPTKAKSLARKSNPKCSNAQAPLKHKPKHGLRFKPTQPAHKAAPTPGMRTGSGNLSKYFRSYRRGLEDFHLPIFQALVTDIGMPKCVLYPGCHRHLTASLVFPNVVYVDSDRKVMSLYTDAIALDWVATHRQYTQQPKLIPVCQDFTHALPGLKKEECDLLVSASAGIVSEHCAAYLCRGGHLLVSDAHYDARMTFLDPRFTLQAVWDSTGQKWVRDAAVLSQHFRAKNGACITAAEVQESIDKPKQQRSFKLMVEELFYLFKRVR